MFPMEKDLTEEIGQCLVHKDKIWANTIHLISKNKWTTTSSPQASHEEAFGSAASSWLLTLKSIFVWWFLFFLMILLFKAHSASEKSSSWPKVRLSVCSGLCSSVSERKCLFSPLLFNQWWKPGTSRRQILDTLTHTSSNNLKWAHLKMVNWWFERPNWLKILSLFVTKCGKREKGRKWMWASDPK